MWLPSSHCLHSRGVPGSRRLRFVSLFIQFVIQKTDLAASFTRIWTSSLGEKPILHLLSSDPKLSSLFQTMCVLHESRERTPRRERIAAIGIDRYSVIQPLSCAHFLLNETEIAWRIANFSSADCRFYFNCRTPCFATKPSF